MGSSSSKLTSLSPRVKGTGEAMKNILSATANSAKRKVQKEGRQYMAPERAQKELERQKLVPKRAPMNIGSAKLSEDSKTAKIEEVEKSQEQDLDYLSLMKDVYVTSEDPAADGNFPSNAHSGKRNTELESKLPKSRNHQETSISNRDIPRGRADLKSVIEALYNHKMNPADWGVGEIAERLRLRESDAKDVLKYFELLDGTNIFRSELPYDSQKKLS